MNSFQKTLPLVLLTASITACDWVDSTGLQRSSTVITLEDGGSLTLLEELPTTARLSGTGQQLRNWEWRAEAVGNLDACIANPDFDINTAEQTLINACANATECQLAIDERSADGATEFGLTLPRLRHSLAAQYLLVSTDDSGQETQRRQTLCGIAVNDPPVALDDEYLVLLFEGLFVSSESANSIIANDYDDNDARNQGLQVDPIPARPPAYARDFELGADGSFYYLPREDAPVSDDGYINDSFVYSISDGNQATQATVRLRVIAANAAPQRSAAIPDMTLRIDEAPFDDFNVADYFFDPDGDALTFSTTSSSLPSSGSMNLLPDGTLQLAPNANETGTWRVTVIASDGLDQSNDTFLIKVQSGLSQNTPPEADDIANQRVSGDFEFDISAYFYDADGDALEFDVAGLPSDVFMTSDGTIFGESTDDNEGSWIVSITASDGRGGEVSDAFRLRIDN